MAAAQAKFSEGSDEQLLTKALAGLTSSRWTLTANGQGLERPFKFKTFAKTWVSLPFSRAARPLLEGGMCFSADRASA